MGQKQKELQRLLDHCIGPREHLRVFILIMADSALRLTEAKRLTRGQIDFEAGVIHVKARTTKRNIMRIVSITDRLADELRKYAEQSFDDDTPMLPRARIREHGGMGDIEGKSRDIRRSADPRSPWIGNDSNRESAG
ncbi:MAG: site-specific integrase [Chloracidobacterium sp.]|nr:site-specific integrase [Chloracidobacterium sp.]